MLQELLVSHRELKLPNHLKSLELWGVRAGFKLHLPGRRLVEVSHGELSDGGDFACSDGNQFLVKIRSSLRLIRRRSLRSGQHRR